LQSVHSGQLEVPQGLQMEPTSQIPQNPSHAVEQVPVLKTQTPLGQSL
jgi:hypothetical protein